MDVTTRPQALLTTPAESAYCAPCETYGVRHEAETFAHCPTCGSTDLLDDRSPFQVLAEAKANVDALVKVSPFYDAETREAIEAETRIARLHVVEQVQAVADLVSDEHLSNRGDCQSWRRRR